MIARLWSKAETPPLARGRPGQSTASSSRSWKHPRLRGEDWPGRYDLTDIKETPPLARGRRISLGFGFVSVRNTPACAGKTRLVSRRRRRCRKHPRLRGEDLTALQSGRFGVGNTPACAGKTQGFAGTVTRGEETPPLARGRQLELLVSGEKSGNTPACAGKT